MKTDIILQTQNLNIGYRKGSDEKIILENINADLYKGELVCLIGPNGVGKSTLLRTLSGVQKPLKGMVLLKNHDLQHYDRQALAKEISLVLTEKITGNLTVYEMVALGRYPHTDWTGSMKQIDEERIDEAINSTGCNDILNQNIYEVSDGQLQKAMIARALAQDGNLMILDEPSAHLDLRNKVEILMLLKNLAKTYKKAVLIATHELDLAMQTADRLWLMAYKQPLQIGAPEDLAIQGYISRAFESKGFQFDLGSGKIKINIPNRRKLQVEGNGKTLFWTIHALERCGYILGDSHVVVKVMEDKWLIENADIFNQTCFSIQDLIEKLENAFQSKV